MYLLILAAVALLPVIALAGVLAMVFVRVDCYGGVRVMGLHVCGGRTQWTNSLSALGAVFRTLG